MHSVRMFWYFDDLIQCQTRSNESKICDAITHFPPLLCYLCIECIYSPEIFNDVILSFELNLKANDPS